MEAPIFNTPINEIFRTIEDRPWLYRPPPLPRTERNVNSKDFCSYHQGTGHKTTDCKALQRYLQKLLQQGYLKQYTLAPGIVPNPAPKKSAPAPGSGKGKDKGPATYKMVSAIFGATPVEGTSSKERIIYVNQAWMDQDSTSYTSPPLPPSEPITFTDEDAFGVPFPHNDALVITIPIGNCKVSRVLVDTGSSVNIMYGQTLNQMEDTPEAARAMVHPQTDPLYGFDGS